MIGRKLDIAMHYDGWQVSWPTEQEIRDAETGHIVMVTWGSPEEEPKLEQINSGYWDPWISSRAEAAKHWRMPFFLRPLWEMNGNWSAWDGLHSDGNPSLYVSAWRRIWRLFQDQGATNTVFVWSPNHEDVPRAPWNHWKNYYPGHDFVGWVGIDGYNWGSCAPFSRWQDPGSIFAPIYNDYAGRKPLMIAESASAEEGGSKAAWIMEARRQIKTDMPLVRAFVWFQQNKECDWRISSSQSALEAYRTLAQDPYFAPKGISAP
jgi:hypothetical protein